MIELSSAGGAVEVTVILGIGLLTADAAGVTAWLVVVVEFLFLLCPTGAAGLTGST